MKINQEKIQEYVKKISPPECPLCHHRNWSINDTIFQLTEFQHGNIIFGGNQTIFPVIPITCDNCGNAYFINPLKAGIITKEDIEKDKEKDAKEKQ